MLVRKYRDREDFKYMLHLAYSRELNMVNLNYIAELPEFGLIALKQDKPIAVGFLRKIEGSYAMMDSFITNSEADAKERHRALDMISSKLIDIANKNGITKLLALSVEPSIMQRLKKLGFSEIEHAATVKLLD